MVQKTGNLKNTKVPGLVDLQVNGFKGVHFSDLSLTQESFVLACRGVLEAGTTAFLPTVITSPSEVYEHNLPIIAAVVRTQEFRGRLLGIHLEGPFISAQDGARGAHDSRWIAKPDVGYLEQLLEWADGQVKLLTIAAELHGAEDLSRHACSRGVAVSLGHQMASEADLQRLVKAGAVSLTHLGNGVPAMLHRHVNPVWAGLANDDLIAMIISDGHHLPASLLKTIIRTKGAGRCVVVSDASSPAGLPPGEYEVLGHRHALDENGRLYEPATGYLAGSSATMLDCMNHLASLDLVSPDELIALGFHNPLRLIGLDLQDVAGERNLRFDAERRVFYIEK
jgi:N-acetylglucosamine-6-phosphate deacetylase